MNKSNNYNYTPVWNENGPHLIRHLEAEKDWEVKKSYYVDGPFDKRMSGDGRERSYDGTREIIKSYDHAVLLDSGMAYMPIKSNLALHRACKDGADTVIVTGADEWIEGPINYIEMPRDYPMANVYITEHNPTGKYNKVEWVNPRMILYPGLVRSVDIHWFWFFMNELVEYETMPTIEGLMIHADDNARPKTRDDLMTAYQDVHSKEERKLLDRKYLDQILAQDYPPTISISGNRYYTCGCIIRPDGVRLLKCPKHQFLKPKL